MGKNKAGKGGESSKGLMIRVPLATVEILREKAEGVDGGALLTEEEVLYKLAVRAVEIGAKSPALVPRT